MYVCMTYSYLYLSTITNIMANTNTQILKESIPNTIPESIPNTLNQSIPNTLIDSKWSEYVRLHKDKEFVQRELSRINHDLEDLLKS
jgi:hypothetical protein